MNLQQTDAHKTWQALLERRPKPITLKPKRLRILDNLQTYLTCIILRSQFEVKFEPKKSLQGCAHRSSPDSILPPRSQTAGLCKPLQPWQTIPRSQTAGLCTPLQPLQHLPQEFTPENQFGLLEKD